MKIKLFLITLLIYAYNDITSAQTQSLTTYFEKEQIEPQAAYGLYYQISKEGDGAKPRKGDYLMLHFTAKLADGTIYESSEANDPFVFQVGHNQVIRGWDLGMTLFPIGSKGTLYIPSELGYGKRGAGRTIPPNADLIIDIELEKKLNQAEYDAYMVELEKKEQAAYRSKIAKQFTEDRKLIQEYSLANKMRTKRTKSGLSYTITKKGKGLLPEKGDELEVKYEGFLLDGSPFEKTKSANTFTFTIGKGKVIEGWDEGLLLFPEGSEGWLLIPSKLAYGPRPIYEKEVNIPANSVLIFKIEVVKVKKSADNQRTVKN